jgi:hypothetical protein
MTIARHFRIVAAFVVLACAWPPVVRGVTAPVEPQTENPEFTLDTWTNRYDRYWREVWDGGDNRFRLKFGSNNVREWNLEEELKLAADLLDDRLRFRFYHSRLLLDSSDQRRRDTFEFELRLRGRYYLSVFATPTFTKAENSIGLMLQHRARVDEYVKLIAELPHAVRNFAERHGDRPGASYTAFTRRPFRLAVDARGALVPCVWGRLVVDYVRPFETATEDNDTGALADNERGEAWSIGGWVEYAAGDRGPDQPAGGIYYHAESRLREGEPVHAGGPVAAALPGRAGGDAPGRIPVGIGNEFYTPTVPDTLRRWSDKRAVLEPFVRLPVAGRWVFKGSPRLDYRELETTDEAGRTSRIENGSIVAGAGGQVALGDTRRAVVEGGFAMEYRDRRQSCGCPGAPARKDIYRDHRLYASFEYRFSPTRVIRLIETIDLAREDWGSFSIHDHGFVQAIFSF